MYVYISQRQFIKGPLADQEDEFLNVLLGKYGFSWYHISDHRQIIITLLSYGAVGWQNLQCLIGLYCISINNESFWIFFCLEWFLLLSYKWLLKARKWWIIKLWANCRLQWNVMGCSRVFNVFVLGQDVGYKGKYTLRKFRRENCEGTCVGKGLCLKL